MENNYLIRRAHNQNDYKNIIELFDRVFYPEKVGELANVFMKSLPGSKYKYWFVAEEKETGKIVSSFMLIPWQWEIQAVKLKVAEMGLVGTDEKHRGKGLIRMLNQEYDTTLSKEGFDMAVIQGIPGFYHKFRYHYALPMENHLNVSLSNIKNEFDTNEFKVKLAELSDIPFLISEDEKYRKANFISSFRKNDDWEYILSNESKSTEYGSEILIFESQKEKFYCRILPNGFGKGFIVSELSESISKFAFENLLSYLKEEAKKAKKPFIRFNIEENSDCGKMLEDFEVMKSKSDAWQIKIPNKLIFLKKLKSILENRIKNSEFNKFSKILRLDFYKETIDLKFENGKIKEFLFCSENEPDFSFNIPEDLFTSLVLGYRNWVELQENRPDIGSMLLYLDPEENPMNDISGKLCDVLFPKEKSWIKLQY